MLSFECDYNNGAHPAVLQALLTANDTKQPGYGQDEYTLRAKETICAACGKPQATVFLLGGGTQTNQVVIDTMLAPYEGVLAADTGHVAVHEAGAIEFTGHKVLTLPQTLGKIRADDVAVYMEKFLADPSHEHMVHPGLVYLSHPTEWGTLYTKEELTAIRSICDAYDLKLYIDGARLLYGLQSPQTDVTLTDLANLTDAFYIGGTKAGTLCGEAVVFPKGNAPKGFFTSIKQHGALFAKGRLLGVQFDALFTDGLYETIGKHAMTKAMELKTILTQKEYEFAWDSPTNQQFVVIDKQAKERLAKQVRFEEWEARPDGRYVVRFATSWATTDQELHELSKIL